MTEEKIDLQAGIGLPISGVQLATAQASICYQGRKDVCLIKMAETSTVASVFTRNQFCAAPVQLAKQHLNNAQPRFLLINAGNANAGTGDAGLQAAKQTCQLVANAAVCEPTQVLPFSTGVIGEDLPTEPFAQVMPQLVSDLTEAAWPDAAASIMTTDTRPKLCSVKIQLPSGVVSVTGMAKGSGMICPDMATMLGYIATDAAIDQTLLQKMLHQAVAPSFNAITVDGDTSTNDACVLIASGASNIEITPNSPEAEQVQAAITTVCLHLAREIVLDGEGATKLVKIQVEGARNPDEARQVGYTVAHSPLVKTALFASDPNWGRILAAVGRAGIDHMVIEQIRIWLGDVCVVSQGGRDPAYQESMGQTVMAQSEITIRIDLAMGDATATILTCDLSHDYVKINAEYRS